MDRRCEAAQHAVWTGPVVWTPGDRNGGGFRGEHRGTRVPGALAVLFMSGEAPDADILGLMRAGDGSHGLRPRAPGTLVPLRPPLTFNLALACGAGRGWCTGQ